MNGNQEAGSHFSLHFVHEKDHFVPQTHIFSLKCTIIWIGKQRYSFIVVREMKVLKEMQTLKEAKN